MDEKNKDILNKLGIYELRLIARQKGIANSSMLKKQDLINKIISFNGNIKSINKGRKSLYDNIKIIHKDLYNDDYYFKNMSYELVKHLTKNFIDFVSKSLNYKHEDKYENIIELINWIKFNDNLSTKKF